MVLLKPGKSRYTETMFRKALTGAGAILVLFHVWLLSGQVWTGEFAEPGRLVRWLFAFALLGALVALKRQGASVWRGRKAVAVWLLAVLLHAPSVADRVATAGLAPLPEVANVLAQIVIASAAAAGLRQLMGFRRLRNRPGSGMRTSAFAIDGGSIGVLSPDAFLQITPRPPPGA